MDQKPQLSSYWRQLLPTAERLEEKMVDTCHSRLLVVGIGLVFIFSILMFQLLHITLFNGGTAKQSRAFYHEKPLFKRKDIVDRNGELIATNLNTASLYADPKKMLDPAEAATKLHEILPDITRKTLLSKLMSNKRFVWIKRNLTPKEQLAINNLGIPGVYFQREEKRIYPHKNLFSHVLGYVSVDGKGLSGIEKYFDKALQSNSSENIPLQLSLDVRIQNILHQELSSNLKKFQAKGAAGIVLDVHSGEVIAMVSLPDFDPHSPGASEENDRFNRATLGVYEMGSTFKAFTAAVALDTGSVSMEDKFNVENPIKAANFTISDFHARKGNLSLPEILMYSSNIGTVLVAQEVGTDIQKHFLKQLGLTLPLSIELPEKSRPLYPSPWRDINMMTIAYGHGIAVTPMHITQGFASTINGGVLYNATLLKTKRKKRIQATHVISRKTSILMQKLLRLVVSKGTGKKANVPGYMVGGKTGTAEKIGQKGRYNQEALLSSFVAAFPMHAPQYVVFAMLDEPVGTKSTGGYATGGMTAAPLVGSVIARIANILNVVPVDEDSEAIRRAFWIDVDDSQHAAILE